MEQLRCGFFVPKNEAPTVSSSWGFCINDWEFDLLGGLPWLILAEETG